MTLVDGRKDESIERFCKELPKVELHAHLNGSLSLDTLRKLAERKQQHGDSAVLQDEIPVASELDNLDNIFRLFSVIHRLIDSCDALYIATVDVIGDFATDGVAYLELRSTPKAVPGTDLTVASYIETVVRAIDDCSKSVDMDVKLLLSIDRARGVDAAIEMLAIAHRIRESSTTAASIIVGCDLSGNPNVNNACDFIPALTDARRDGLALAVHIAETLENANESLPFLEALRPDRLGHATFLHLFECNDDQRQDADAASAAAEKCVEIVRRSLIPIEICLTSNVKSQTVRTFDDHHVKFWLAIQHPIAICTDDAGVFSSQLSNELALAAGSFALSRQQLVDLQRSAIDFAFGGDDSKRRFRERLQRFEERMAATHRT